MSEQNLPEIIEVAKAKKGDTVFLKLKPGVEEQKKNQIVKIANEINNQMGISLVFLNDDIEFVRTESE